MIFLYLAKFSESLVEAWLKQSSQKCLLLVERETREQGLQLQMLFKNIARVIEMDQEKEIVTYLDKVSATERKLIVPLNISHRQLRFLPSENIPEISGLYPLFHTFRKIGFQTVEIFTPEKIYSLTIPHLLDDFINKHKGQRCFIVGNGPSLNEIEMPKLKGEITLGSNRCFLGYEKWGFAFNYWGIVDRLQIEEYRKEYETSVPRETPKFFPFEYLPFLNFENACPVNHFYDYPDYPQFSDVCDKLYLGSSVTYFLLQIAVMMGCNPIYFVGLDHRYHLKDYEEDPLPVVGRWSRLKERIRKSILGASQPKEPSLFWTAAKAGAETHFDSRYTQGGQKRFIRPRPRRAEMAYDCATAWGRQHGVEMLNATPGTGLKCFPTVKFEGLF
jgi:hypothetical protein